MYYEKYYVVSISVGQYMMYLPMRRLGSATSRVALADSWCTSSNPFPPQRCRWRRAGRKRHPILSRAKWWENGQKMLENGGMMALTIGKTVKMMMLRLKLASRKLKLEDLWRSMARFFIGKIRGNWWKMTGKWGLTCQKPSTIVGWKSCFSQKVSRNNWGFMMAF